MVDESSLDHASIAVSLDVADAAGKACFVTGKRCFISVPPLLTTKLRLQFIRGLEQEYRSRLASSLQGQVVLELNLQGRTDVVASSAHLVFRHLETGEVSSPPQGTSITQMYDRTQRGLLLLGPPGSGKTTLLLELAQELLHRAENDPDQPFAIILNLSTWARTQPPLAQWLSEQCLSIYGISRQLSAAWIAREQVQFLLDGLDEMETSARTSCIKAINTYRQAHLVPLVVCSRSQEYESQPARLILPGAVEIRPLETAQISRMLKQAGKSLADVRATLRTNTILRDLLTTPLMLNVVILTYRDKTAEELPQMGTSKDQQRQIFEKYVQCMLKRYQQSLTFSPKYLFNPLVWLARQMQQRHLTEFYLESLQADWLENDRALYAYLLTSQRALGLTIGLMGGLLVGVVIGLISRLIFGTAGALIGGPLVGVMFGPVFGALGWRFGRTEEIHLIERFTWSWRKGTAVLGAGLVGGLGAGLLLSALTFLPESAGYLITELMGGQLEG